MGNFFKWIVGADSLYGKKGGGGGGGDMQGIEIPPFFEDEFYKSTQDTLFGLGKDVLAGNLPDYYKPLGEMGGDLFDDILNKTIAKTVGAVDESAIRRGVSRGGTLSTATSAAVADTTSQMTWNDYLRALGERSKLFGFGTNVVEGVRSAGLTNQAQRNNYNLGKAGLELQDANTSFNQDQAYGVARGGGIAEMIDQIESVIDPVKSIISGKKSDGAKMGSADYAKSAVDIAKLVAMLAA